MIRLLRIVSSLITLIPSDTLTIIATINDFLQGNGAPSLGSITALINIKTLFLFAKQYPEIADHNCEQNKYDDYRI